MQACFDILNKRFSNYTLHNIVLNKKAVSNNNGVAKIFYDVDKSGLASLYKRNLNSYTINMDKFEMVETVRLDTYITERSIDHIHFLKLDIEGHELAALHGLGTFRSGEFIDFIQFEYGGANIDSHTSLMELYVLFEDAGFVVAKIMRKGLEIRSYKPWMDNFQYGNYVAISKKKVDKL